MSLWTVDTPLFYNFFISIQHPSDESDYCDDVDGDDGSAGGDEKYDGILTMHFTMQWGAFSNLFDGGCSHSSHWDALGA